ncbi:helix-turn-helix domain-containing protein [Oceanobacillus sp. FSL H7-0719]|uniref:helix-turn-helix domain-containing protein n=1 Tax=Oceanobacillus sp. FSL H7-0719 TaxID=2954507 RepID=UPI00324C604F
MIDIGSFIKLQRTKQKMTLGELADGIVSVSYLSKIENLKTDASPNIIQLLCNRLGIELNNNLEDVIKEKCEEWYSMLFYNQDVEMIIEGYENIQLLLDRNLSENMVLFEIHKIRYFLILGDSQSALNQINKLNKMINSFESKELYFWFKFRGNYSSSIGEVESATEKYQKAEKIIRKLDLSEEELADLQYTMSITYSKLRQTLESIDYANMALDIFMKKYNFLRCAQCHVVLGISYRRLKMYDKAIENYNLAKHLATIDNNNEIIQLTNQNLGFLYAAKGSDDEAVKFYSEIVVDPEVEAYEKLAALTQLIKVYYENEQLEKANEMSEIALKLLDENQNEVEHEYYHNVIHTYYYAINKQSDKFTALVKDSFIPFLKKHKDYANLVIIAQMLAKHYESIHKYKDATKYYKLANFSYKELSNI